WVRLLLRSSRHEAAPAITNRGRSLARRRRTLPPLGPAATACRSRPGTGPGAINRRGEAGSRGRLLFLRHGSPGPRRHALPLPARRRGAALPRSRVTLSTARPPRPLPGDRPHALSVDRRPLAWHALAGASAL